MNNVDNLTKLPAPPSSPPTLSSGEVRLYRDSNWQSGSLTLSTRDYHRDVRHTIPKSGYDNATYVAFNLPIGTVMTLMDDIASVEDGYRVSNLRNCGRCVDLVGNGQTQGVDLMAVNMNDRVSRFFWREVDLDLGAIELFENVNFGGNRAILFLCEWDPDEFHSIAEWWLQDKVSSVRWRTLNDRQTAGLFQNANGSGDSYKNIKGYGDTKEIANLDEIRFNDSMSSFCWNAINPKKELIKPFEIKTGNQSDSSSLTSVINGTNQSSLPQQVEVALTNEEAQKVTVSTTDTHVTGVTSTFSQTYSSSIEKAGVKVGSETTWSVELKYEYEHSETISKSETKTIALSISETVNAPPNTNYTATLLVTIGKIPATVYKTTAERWYDQPVTGAIEDQGLWKRTEPVTVTVEGGLASEIRVNIEAIPID